MSYSTSTTNLLQSLLFSHEDISSCFLREPTKRELEFHEYFNGLQALLSRDERRMLYRYHRKGRIGYDLSPILGIQILKLYYKVSTIKDTLLMLEENENLRMILCLCEIPSPATMSRLTRKVEQIVKPTILHERLIQCYDTEMDRVVGHLSIDSTTIEAREKPIKKQKNPKDKTPLQKRGPKIKGSVEEKEYLERKEEEQKRKQDYLTESPEASISGLEMRCSLTAKKNSKGKLQWFIGYKAHIATDDFGVPISFAVTGACVHDCKVAVPLMKLAHQRTNFFYALMDKGYLNPDINDYADLIEKKVIIDQRSRRGVAATPMEEHKAVRYKARSTVERTNSELKDGFLPDKIYRKGSHARYDIELSLLLTTFKKVLKMLRLKEKEQAKEAS